MKILIAIFFGSLLMGQFGAIAVTPGVVIYAHDVLLGILLIWALCTTRRLWSKISFLPISRFIGIFIVVTLLSLFWNASRFTPVELLISSLYALRWVFYASVFFIVVASDVTTEFWLWCLYAAGVGLSMLGLMQYVLYPDLRNLIYLGWDPHSFRLFSTLFDPNFVGLLLVLSIFLGIYLFASSHRYRIALLVTLLIVLASLFLTFSRSSYLALLAGGFVWVIGTRRWSYGLIIILSVVSLFLVLPKPQTEGGNLWRIASSRARVNNWQYGWELFTRQPVLGHGFDTLRYVAPEQDALSRSRSGLDNSVLFLLATTGIVGTLAYMVLIREELVTARFLFDHKKTRSFGVLLLVVLAAMFVHSFFINSLFYPWILLWSWVVFGVAERMRAIYDR